MRKPSILPSLDQNQLQALGHVTAQWSFLEYLLDHVLFGLYMEAHHRNPNHENPRTHFRRRMKMIRELVSLKYDEGRDETIKKLTCDASNLGEKRDNLVHGLFGKPGQTVEAISIKIFKGFKTSKGNNSADDMEALACEISNITWQLSQALRVQALADVKKTFPDK